MRRLLAFAICLWAGLTVACSDSGAPTEQPSEPLGVLAAGVGDSDAGPDVGPDVVHGAKNVLLISIDTLRPDFLGAYDAEREGTPAIDRLAKTGVVFEDALAQGASTAISHKSILYSLYPAVHKTTVRTVPVETVVSPIEALTALGWRTAAFVDGGQLDPGYGVGRGFEVYDSHGNGDRDFDELTRTASQWLDENAASPFFLMLHTYKPHAPYEPPARLRERFAGWYEGDLDPTGKKGKNFYNDIELSEEDVRFIRALYEAEVAFSDEFVGGVLDVLEAKGLSDNTIVVLLSDHGESLGEADYVGHNQLEPVQLRIPIIMRFPGVAPRRVAEPIESIDVMPTLFAALGVEPPYAFQGVNLLPTLTGAATLPEDRPRIAQQGMRVVVETSEWRWRFDLEGKRPEGLFRIDPSGRVVPQDIATRWPDEGRRLKQTFRDMVRDSEAIASAFQVDADVDPTEDEELRKQLTALGYL